MALAIPAAALKDAASCGLLTLSVPEITALQSEQLSTASIAPKPPPVTGWCTIPGINRSDQQIYSPFINSLGCQHKSQQILFSWESPSDRWLLHPHNPCLQLSFSLRPARPSLPSHSKLMLLGGEKKEGKERKNKQAKGRTGGGKRKEGGEGEKEGERVGRWRILCLCLLRQLTS